MVNEDKLSAVLSDFARTVITDFPIHDVLDQLVTRIVEILPVTGAGITLVSVGEAPRYVAASSSDALRFAQLQTDFDDGPCLAACEHGTAITVPDLTAEVRFPMFTKAAVGAGLAAAFAFPVRHDAGCLGALDLYRRTPGDLDASDLDAAQTLADVAAAYLLNARARDDARRAAGHSHHLLMHDPLTGLPNRLLFQERIEHAARRARRSHANVAVLFADLDDFEHVNDAHGHLVGDELLCVVAHRLTRLLRPGDTLARFAGDEFVILCEDLASPTDVDGLARRINHTMSKPFVMADAAVTVTASVGIAFAGPGEDVSHQLVIEADRAMSAVKRSGRNGHQIVDVRSGAPTRERITLEDEVRVALATNQLGVHYQPVIRMADQATVGVETLLRWAHTDHGSVPPGTIVRIAERSGLINELGEWVLERACSDHRQWMLDNPGASLDLAVNVSGHQLVHRRFAANVADIIARTEMDPAALILEITEDTLIDDSRQIMTVLAEIRSTGVRIAIDDFGTGYSSLSYLTRLPIDIVKIDQCFVADSAKAGGRTVVRAITDLSHDLGLVVIAEGVETQIHHDQLLAIDCDFAQGYLYARPMTAAAIRADYVPHLAGRADDAVRSGATALLHASASS